MYNFPSGWLIDRGDFSDFLLRCQQELNLHLLKHEPIIQKAFRRTNNVKEYWVTLAATLPTISQVALLLCRIAASEADCERVFSLEGNLHDRKRNRLEPELVEKMVFIRYNWEKLISLDCFEDCNMQPEPLVSEVDYVFD